MSVLNLKTRKTLERGGLGGVKSNSAVDRSALPRVVLGMGKLRSKYGWYVTFPSLPYDLRT